MQRPETRHPVTFRVWYSERELLRAAAAAEDRSVPQYIRYHVLQAALRTKGLGSALPLVPPIALKARGGARKGKVNR